jgi:hypothetical protein
MTDLDLEIRRRPVKPDAKTHHDWSLPSHPLLQDPVVRARMAKAISQRQLERQREMKMRPSRRERHNRAMAEQRARDLATIFSWRLDDVGFPLSALSPCSCGCNDGCDHPSPTLRDRDAGYDHPTYFRHRDGRPVLVCQPYRPAFECGKREGAVSPSVCTRIGEQGPIVARMGHIVIHHRCRSRLVGRA